MICVNLATVRDRQGDLAGARSWFERARERCAELADWIDAQEQAFEQHHAEG